MSVSIYRDGDGAHKDLREIYEPGEPHNPPQWKEVEPIVQLGDETMAQIGTDHNEGRIWLSWRRGGMVYSVSRYLIPGEPQSSIGSPGLARIVDQRAQASAALRSARRVPVARRKRHRIGTCRAYHDLGRRASDPSSRRPEDRLR